MEATSELAAVARGSVPQAGADGPRSRRHLVRELLVMSDSASDPAEGAIYLSLNGRM